MKQEYSPPELEVLGDLHTMTTSSFAPGRGDWPLSLINLGGNPKGS